LSDEPTVLVVDDETAGFMVLEGMLRPLGVKVFAAKSGAEALSSLKEHKLDLILLDVMMPGLDGFEVCREIRSRPETQELPIILVTALDDRESRIRGLEAGADDFVSKPFDSEELRARVKTTLKLNRYRSLVEERDRAAKAYEGSIQVMKELLALRNPAAFAHIEEIQHISLELADRVGLKNVEALKMASLLCQIGRLTLPDSLIEKEAVGEALTPEEEKLFQSIPRIGHKLLSAVPLLQEVADIVLWQDKNFDGKGYPARRLARDKIPIESRIVRVARDFRWREAQGFGANEVLQRLEGRSGVYDPKIINALSEYLEGRQVDSTGSKREYMVEELEDGMTISSDVVTANGSVAIVKKGIRLTEAMIVRIQNFKSVRGIREPILVMLADGSES
jgi:putative two-component system response regulator